jgi:hypothetical protein
LEKNERFGQDSDGFYDAFQFRFAAVIEKSVPCQFNKYLILRGGVVKDLGQVSFPQRFKPLRVELFISSFLNRHSNEHVFHFHLLIKRFLIFHFFLKCVHNLAGFGESAF